MLDLPAVANEAAERAPSDAVAEVAAESALEWAFRRVEELIEETAGQATPADAGPPGGAEAHGQATEPAAASNAPNAADRDIPVTGETAGDGTAAEAGGAGQDPVTGGPASTEEKHRVNRVVIPVVDSSRLRLADRYWLEQRIGRGGSSDIWRAFDELLARPVSVLVVDRRIEIDSRLRAALTGEMRAAAALRHPELVAVYDSGFAVGPNDTETPYIVMEPLEGETLAARLERGPLANREAVRVCAAVAAALSRAHGAGMVHRDVSASHIFLTPDGVRLLGLGLGRALAQPAETAGPCRRQGSGGSTLSAAKVADVRALGAVLVNALTGGSGADASDPSARADPSVPPGELVALCRRLLGRQGSVRSAADAASLLTEAFTGSSAGETGTRGRARSGMPARVRRAGRASRNEEARDQDVPAPEPAAEGARFDDGHDDVPVPDALLQDVPVPDAPLQDMPVPDITAGAVRSTAAPAAGSPVAGVAAADEPEFRSAEAWRAVEWRAEGWQEDGWRGESLPAEARPAERPRRGRRRVVAAGLAVVLVSGLLIGVSQQNLRWPANLLSAPERKTPSTPVPTGQAEVPTPSPSDGPTQDGGRPPQIKQPAPPVNQPGGDDRKTTAPPQRESPPPVADPAVIRTLENLRESVNRGLRFRQMRPDVAQDFNNVITNLRRDLEGGRVKDPGPRAAKILEKIDTRVREGALDPDRAERMRAQLSSILPG